MTIGSVSSILESNNACGVSSARSQTSDSSDVGTASGVSVNVSRPGQLMGELNDLAQSDPAKFKSVTADIAQKLKDAAASSSGREADALNKLADRFSAASQSGNPADLRPQEQQQASQGQHRHHHHHAAGQAAGGGDSILQTLQGIVSSALQAAGVGGSSTVTAPVAPPAPASTPVTT